FLSSRRRHTRCYRDWSSDVCSSDLDDSLNGGQSESLSVGREVAVHLGGKVVPSQRKDGRLDVETAASDMRAEDSTDDASQLYQTDRRPAINSATAEQGFEAVG